MGLNCKPDQRAWIKVPPTRKYLELGLDQINGHVVQTLYIHPESTEGEPAWVVDPPQWCRLPADVLSRDGTVTLKAGLRFNLRAVPDEFLRPFDDFPPEELDNDHVHLQLEAIL